MNTSLPVELENIHQQLTTFFLDHLNTEIPSGDFDLIETGYLDSLGLVELLLHLEQAYGVEFSMEELEIDHFRSLDRIAQFIRSHNGA